MKAHTYALKRSVKKLYLLLYSRLSPLYVKSASKPINVDKIVCPNKIVSP